MKGMIVVVAARRMLERAVFFVAGVIMIAAFFFTARPLATAEKEMQNWGVIIAAFALGIASVNLIQVHVNNMVRGKPEERLYSGVLILSLIGTTVLGLAKGLSSKEFQFWFNAVVTPGGGTVWALGAFYIASAAFRAFRMKNIDSTLLLVAAVVVMLGGVPIGEAIWPGFPSAGKWITDIPNMAATRGMMIGAGLGAIASGLRGLLGIERSYLGGSE